MKKKYLVVTIVLVVFSFASGASAQATEFTYQGRLLFGDVPANGNYDFEFALFDADTGGNQLGANFPLSAVSVNNGVFSVRIDFGDQFPGASRFLEIHVRQTGTSNFAVLSPRQSISSAPYSIKSLNSASSQTAVNALSLGGTRANQFVVTSDTRLSDTRDPRPGSASYIQNTTLEQPVANFNISGDGTAGGTLSANSVNSLSGFTIGGVQLLNINGPSNTFAGIHAGVSTVLATDGSGGGIRNSIFGNDAGRFNTSGASNSFFGFEAGQTSTTGSSNSFFGDRSGLNNGAGSSNSYFGVFAGLGDLGTTSSGGSANSFFGAGAGSHNGTGNNNASFGANANLSASDLNFATAIGSRALVTSSDTIVLGKVAGTYAGVSRPADSVFAPGSVVVGNSITVGDTATVNGVAFFGRNVTIASSLVTGTDLSVGRGLTVGDTATINGVALFQRNVTVGSSLVTGTDVTVGRNLTVNGTLSTASNLSTTTNLGVGTATPAAKVDIAVNSGHVLLGNAGCNAGFTGIGFAATLAGCTNYSLLGNGTDTILNRPTGGSLAFRENNATQMSIASGGVVSITTLGSGGTSALCRNASGQISTCAALQGEGSDTFVKSPSGTVHLRTAAGDLSLAPSGTVSISGLLSLGTVPGGGSLHLCLSGTTVSLCSSSIRYKTNINTFGSGLDLIKRLRPVTFNWRSDNSRDLGLVAEDVAKVEPLLVTHNDKGQVEGVKYDRVGVVLVNAVNEQQSQIEAQQRQIDAQKKIIEQQQAEIDAMKKLVCSQNRSASLCRPGR